MGLRMKRADVRRDTINKVFVGVRNENYENVSHSIDFLSRVMLDIGYEDGHLKGLLLGICVGSLVSGFVTIVILSLFS